MARTWTEEEKAEASRKAKERIAQADGPKNLYQPPQNISEYREDLPLKTWAELNEPPENHLRGMPLIRDMTEGNQEIGVADQRAAEMEHSYAERPRIPAAQTVSLEDLEGVSTLTMLDGTGFALDIVVAARSTVGMGGIPRVEVTTVLGVWEVFSYSDTKEQADKVRDHIIKLIRPGKSFVGVDERSRIMPGKAQTPPPSPFRQPARGHIEDPYRLEGNQDIFTEGYRTVDARPVEPQTIRQQIIPANESERGELIDRMEADMEETD